MTREQQAQEGFRRWWIERELERLRSRSEQTDVSLESAFAACERALEVLLEGEDDEGTR